MTNENKMIFEETIRQRKQYLTPPALGVIDTQLDF